MDSDAIRRIRELAAVGKISFASDEAVVLLRPYVQEILDELDFGYAWVSDESTFADFWAASDLPGTSRGGLTPNRLAAAAAHLGIDLRKHDRIWEAAQRLALARGS